MYLGLHSFHLVSFSPFSLNHFQTHCICLYSSHLFSASLYRYDVLPFSLFYFSLSLSHFSSFLFCFFFLLDIKISLGGTFFHLTNSTRRSCPRLYRQIKATIYIFDQSWAVIRRSNFLSIYIHETSSINLFLKTEVIDPSLYSNMINRPLSDSEDCCLGISCTSSIKAQIVSSEAINPPDWNTKMVPLSGNSLSFQDAVFYLRYERESA